jgi:hypothetical protein
MNLRGEVKGASYDFVGFASFLELDILANCNPCHYPMQWKVCQMVDYLHAYDVWFPP